MSDPDNGPETDLDTLTAASAGGAALDSVATPLRIASYRVRRKLGEGGMGVVYEAEQAHPQRRVAIKVIRGGAFVDELQVRMFRREVDTLARLKHPGIGSIYDAGRTESGCHFFAMELVEGETLDKYLAGRPPATERRETEHRLRILSQICDAVHYAHQRGVIHRDLKPSNIIVVAGNTSETGSDLPQVKILDFGLARITDQDGGATALTRAGNIRGTLPYMSPEQARGEIDEIDSRTDVYALGVILYEMLSGQLPYDTRQNSLLSSLRVICEEPAQPLRLAWRGVRRVDPDLETIVGKALEKEPRDRYGSASALSQDVERFLTSQPILARPPSTAYQIKKLVERNRLPTALAAMVLVLLVGFSVWMSVLFARATRAEAAATREAETATRVSDFMVEIFEISDPGEARGNTITAREILDRGAERIERELAPQPVVQGRLLHTVGRVYRSLGLWHESAQLLRSGLDQRRKALGPEHPETADSLAQLGVVQTLLGEYDEAEALLHQALEVRRRALGPGDPRVVSTLAELGFHYRERGDWRRGKEVLESLMPLQEQLLGPRHADYGDSLVELGILERHLGGSAKSESSIRRGLTILEQSLPPDHPRPPQVAMILANIYSESGREDEALTLYRGVLEFQKRVLGPEHPDVAYTLHNLALLNARLGNLDEAEAQSRRTVRLAERLVGTEHFRYGIALEGLASVRWRQGHLQEAIGLFERATSIIVDALGPEGAEPARHLNNLGRAYLELERWQDAEAVGRRVLAHETALGPHHPQIAGGCELLGRALLERGRYGEAEQLLRRALTIRLEQNAGDPGIREIRTTLERLAEERRKTQAPDALPERPR